MQRGINDDFYFVRNDKGGQSDSLMRVKVKVDSHELVWESQQLSAPFLGRIMALELDPLNNNDIEKPQQINWEDDWQDKHDKIFLIDENKSFFKASIARDCEITDRRDLSEHKVINEALETKVRNRKFVRIGMSDRCISIFGKTYNYHTG